MGQVMGRVGQMMLLFISTRAFLNSERCISIFPHITVHNSIVYQSLQHTATAGSNETTRFLFSINNTRVYHN